jgi:predicted phosphodiesterase
MSEMWLLAPDLHYPRHSRRTWWALVDFARRNKVHGFVFMGDQFDNAEISHHNAGKPLYKPVGSYAQYTRCFERDIMRQLPAFKRRVWMIGNHDQWEYDMDETHPELQGALDRVTALNLYARGWDVIKNGRALALCKHLTIIHGDQLKGAMGYMGANVPRKAIDIYGKSVAFGHTHTFQVQSSVNPIEVSKKRVGWNLPVLCELNPDYMRNRPSAWVNGFGIVEVRPDGTFSLWPVVVTNGVFTFAGRTYGSK